MFILIILLSIFFLYRPSASPVERKECYYNLNDENLCESVLTSHVTLQECCCTLGAGWGDNCEVHPCPVNGTGEWSSVEGFLLYRSSVYPLCPKILGLFVFSLTRKI